MCLWIRSLGRARRAETASWWRTEGLNIWDILQIFSDFLSMQPLVKPSSGCDADAIIPQNSELETDPSHEWKTSLLVT